MSDGNPTRKEVAALIGRVLYEHCFLYDPISSSVVECRCGEFTTPIEYLDKDQNLIPMWIHQGIAIQEAFNSKGWQIARGG